MHQDSQFHLEFTICLIDHSDWDIRERSLNTILAVIFLMPIVVLDFSSGNTRSKVCQTIIFVLYMVMQKCKRILILYLLEK